MQAKRFFTVAEDGLRQTWFGRVWLNPPFEGALILAFIDKLTEEWTSGRVEQAILLTHSRTDRAWFQAAARASRMICFSRARVRFLSLAGDKCSPTQGQAFFYFGRDDRGFRAAFGDCGLLMRLA